MQTATNNYNKQHKIPETTSIKCFNFIVEIIHAFFSIHTNTYIYIANYNAHTVERYHTFIAPTYLKTLLCYIMTITIG